MTKALLIELGCEELPARFVRPGLAALKEAVEEALRTARIPFGEATTYGTPVACPSPSPRSPRSVPIWKK